MLLVSLSGCVKTQCIEGLWFDKVHVKGTALVGGCPTPVDGEYANVYLIHEDTVVEMLKQ